MYFQYRNNDFSAKGPIKEDMTTEVSITSLILFPLTGDPSSTCSGHLCPQGLHLHQEWLNAVQRVLQRNVWIKYTGKDLKNKFLNI